MLQWKKERIKWSIEMDLINRRNIRCIEIINENIIS